MRRNVNYRKLERQLIGGCSRDKSKIVRKQFGKQLTSTQYHNLHKNAEIILTHPTMRYLKVFILGNNIKVVDTLRLISLNMIEGDYVKFYYEGKTISLHRFIAECKYNRMLEEGEEVHHLNQKTLDSHPRNLLVVTGEQHRFLHKMLKEIKK